MNCTDAQSKLADFERMLRTGDKAEATVRKYVGDVRIFLAWCGRNGIDAVSVQVLQAYRDDLIARRKVSGCNSVIISLNKFFRIFAENEGLHLRVFRTQRRTSLDSVLSMREYRMLLDKAVEIGNRRLYCIMRTLASSGIRIGELAYITVESLCSGICPVVSKGRARDIFIPHEVCRLLLDYCAAAGIKSGLVFCSQGNPGKMMDKSQIWRELDRLGRLLHFPKGYVHAHSFRHFFAKRYICEYKDVCELADILGHSSIETTRIYTRTTLSEKKSRIEALRL